MRGCTFVRKNVFSPATHYLPFAAVHSAFTLIELLVVIAIIAILAAILFPVFSRVREKARQASCMSNFKQVSNAMGMYAQDYDGFIVPESVLSQGIYFGWPTILFPYVKNSQVFACPSGERGPTQVQFVSRNGPGPTNCPSWYIGMVGVTYNMPNHNIHGGPICADGTNFSVGCVVNELSYSYNNIPQWQVAWVSFDFAVHGPKNGFAAQYYYQPIHEASIGDPAGTIHIIDGWALASQQSFGVDAHGYDMRRIRSELTTDIWPNCNSPSPNASYSKVSNRHIEGFNAIYGDGHVKWRKYGTTRPEEWTVQQD
jgi:prepilin-type N-terminal cleavage/methylation domain-containing protein